jgi:hypothetical protein
MEMVMKVPASVKYVGIAALAITMMSENAHAFGGGFRSGSFGGGFHSGTFGGGFRNGGFGGGFRSGSFGGGFHSGTFGGGFRNGGFGGGFHSGTFGGGFRNGDFGGGFYNSRPQGPGQNMQPGWRQIAGNPPAVVPVVPTAYPGQTRPVGYGQPAPVQQPAQQATLGGMPSLSDVQNFVSTVGSIATTLGQLF